MRDNEIAYEIVKRIGVINRYPTGWNKEINLVSWNGGAAKYDIRDWDPDHARMSRGGDPDRAGVCTNDEPCAG